MPFLSTESPGGMFWSTDMHAEADRCDYWREAVCREFVALDAVPRCPRHSFYGSIHTESLGPLAVADIRAAAQLVRRGPREINDTPGNCYYLITQLSGTGRIEQFGNRVSLLAGDGVIVDSRFPYVLSFDDEFRQLNISIPYESVSGLCDDPVPVAVTLKNIWPLLHSYLDILGVPRINADAEYYELATANIMEMIAILAGHAPLHRSVREDERLQKITLFIRSYYDDPALTAIRVAEAAHVSTRLLYKLFSRRGTTFGAYLRDLRLEQARQNLVSLDCPKNVTEVAMGNGFDSLSSFSRAFKQRYGMSPSQYRNHFLHH